MSAPKERRMVKKLALQVPDSLYDDLLEIAALCHEAPEELLVRAFREWMELREDMEDVRIAEERVAEYDGAGRATTHEELVERLGLGAAKKTR